MPNTFPIVATFAITHADCDAILTTALETGYCSWLQCRRIERDPVTQLMVSVEARPHHEEGKPFAEGDSRNDWQTMTPATIAAGVQLVVSPGFNVATSTRHQIAELLGSGDISAVDVEQADCILQAAMFKELVFG